LQSGFKGRPWCWGSNQCTQDPTSRGRTVWSSGDPREGWLWSSSKSSYLWHGFEFFSFIWSSLKFTTKDWGPFSKLPNLWALESHIETLSLLIFNHSISLYKRDYLYVPMSRDGPWPDPTQPYFWPAVNKRPTCHWPGYFLTWPKDIFFDPKGKKIEKSSKPKPKPEPQKIDLTWPGSKIFDLDPSLPMSLFHSRTAGPNSTKFCTDLHYDSGRFLTQVLPCQPNPWGTPNSKTLTDLKRKNFALQNMH